MQHRISCVVVALAALAATQGDALAFDRASVVTGAKLSSYNSVYVAPVKVSLGSSKRSVSARDAQAKAADLREEIVDAFVRSHTIKAGPGPEVLTISATLTKLVADMPTAADYQDDPALSPDSVYAGSAGFEAALSSSAGDLASVADDYDGLLDRFAPPVATWQDADRAFSSWARRLQDFVEEN